MRRDIALRHLILRRAADLASSGGFQTVEDVALELRKEGIDSGRHFSAATTEWLNELCQRSHHEAKVRKHRKRDAKLKTIRKA